MIVRTSELDIDVLDYLESKGVEKLHKIGDNLMMCCPFHSDSNPSFGVHEIHGTFQCFGCGIKGNFQKLVRHLEDFGTLEDAEEYLIGKYGKDSIHSLSEPLELKFTEKPKRIDYCISEESLEKYKFPTTYMQSRGISQKWVDFFEIGYSPSKRAIAIPYRNEKGRLLTMKMRGTVSKSFWYEPAMPTNVKKQTIFALDKAKQSPHKIVAITEAEIDCISVWQSEMCSAIGIGGNQFSNEQARKMIQNIHYDSEILLFVDNDAGGEVARKLITDKLIGHFKISQVDWSLIDRDVKDANDLTVDEIKQLIENRVPRGLEIF